MSIFDVFTFKKEAAKVFSKENFANILELARAEIVRQIKENCPGVEKKAIVDQVVIRRLLAWKDECNNKMVKWVIDRIILAVPTVTQLVYNFLKEKIENL